MTITEAFKSSVFVKRESWKYGYICLIDRFLYSADTRLIFKKRWSADYEDIMANDWITCDDIKTKHMEAIKENQAILLF